MSRQSRVVAVGVPHHITQRGNNRQTIFRSDADRILYLASLRLKAREHGMSILGYCLLSNHVHLVAIPSHENSLSRAIGQTHFIYVQRFNRGTHRSGHLWQGRFYSAPAGPDRLDEVLLYVDLNAVRARIVKHATDYAWSSASSPWQTSRGPRGGLLRSFGAK